MTSDSSRQVPDSSSSGPTAVSTRCESTIELGSNITKQLDLDQSVDTLGRWMAHYIAELIQDVEKATPQDRPAKMRACSEAILSLWQHRYELSNGKGPFRQLEPILRALESLDPEEDTPRYFRSVRLAADEANEEDAANSWLQLVDDLDYSARTLILYGLTQAAKNALDKSAKWVALAEAAGADDGVELPLIRVLLEEEAMSNGSDPDKMVAKRLDNRINRLEAFANMALALVSELRQQAQRPTVGDS